MVIVADCDGIRKSKAPKFHAFSGAGHWKMDGSLEAQHKGQVDVALEIRCADHHAAPSLQALEKVADLLIGILVLCVADTVSFAKQRVGFIVEQDPVLIFAPVEKVCQVFFCLADVPGNDH